MRLFPRFFLKFVSLLALLHLEGCNSTGPRPEAPEPKGPTWFQSLPPERTGIDFGNFLQDSDTLNILNYLYYYNGGGVAIGDLDGDSLPEVVFTGNQSGPALYHNLGNLHFEDVTLSSGLKAGIGSNPWFTGIALADVNGDGLLDIYLCRVGGYLNLNGKNQLFINQGGLQFEEAASEWGVDHEGFSTQAAFFDYDLDGDLDMYLLCHSVHSAASFQDIGVRNRPDARAGDRLFRNDGNRFTDVTADMGLYSSALGYGLGVSIADFNRDGWPDVYVANDFHENDYLYLNEGGKAFREVIREAMGHTSRFSMGCDAADINQDGWPDLITLDMMPRQEAIFKTAEPPEPFDAYQYKLRFGFHHQFPRNCLQINRGDGAFYNASFLAGVYATDWSWSALLQDFDLDGLTDLFITNGIFRRPNDLDYINFIGSEPAQRLLAAGMKSEDLEFVKKMPQVQVGSYLFRNQGLLAFEDVSARSGLHQPAFSNGAAYGDLDGDGDADLVVNNIGRQAFIFQNLAADRGGNWVQVRLKGKGKNPFGIGARIALETPSGIQVREQYLSRGFLSSVDPALVLGLGAADNGLLTVTWPDGSQEMKPAKRGDRLTFDQARARKPVGARASSPAGPPGVLLLEGVAPPFIHQEDVFNDQNNEPLMPWLLSREGPALAVGDVNGDGRDDVFLGGAKGQPSALFFQLENGTFQPSDSALWRGNLMAEDVAAAFFDADLDGDLDLWVAPGGNEFPESAAIQQCRLYLNDGKGNFSKSPLPQHGIQAGCVAVHDYDQDGLPDVFVGARVLHARYGADPTSLLFRNLGNGKFEETSAHSLPVGGKLGMITAAQWANIDQAPGAELVLTGEWLAPFALKPGPGMWQRLDLGLGAYTGFWRALCAADIDNDGDLDLVMGNLGLNSYLRASQQEPIRLFLKDFDDNGTDDPILTMYKEDGMAYPLASRDELFRQMPHLRKRYPTYESFGSSAYKDIFSEKERFGAAEKQVVTLAHHWFENDGKGKFTARPLPRTTQITAVNALLWSPNWKGKGPRLWLGGNFFGLGALSGRLDASWLSALDGYAPQWTQAHLAPARAWETRQLALFTLQKQPTLVVGCNSGTPAFVR